MLVFVLVELDLDFVVLMRFLFKVELIGLEICLCLSKCDFVFIIKMEEWYS